MCLFQPKSRFLGETAQKTRKTQASHGLSLALRYDGINDPVQHSGQARTEDVPTPPILAEMRKLLEKRE